jgi:ferredoxin
MEKEPTNPFNSAPFLDPVFLNLNQSQTGMPSGIKIFIDPVRCIGCGLCGEVCPFGLAVAADFGKFDIPHPELCTECSACKRNCPVDAIFMEEREGCGCLWDVASRRKKGNKKGKGCC